MTSIIKRSLIFGAGAIVGALGTLLYTKDYYESLAQDEIDSVKATYTYKKPVETEDSEDVVTEISYEHTKREKVKHTDEEGKPILGSPYSNEGEKLARVAKELNYIPYGHEDAISKESAVRKSDVNYLDKIYVIDPEIYEEPDEYQKIEMTYYAGNNILTQCVAGRERVVDMDSTVGNGELLRWGKSEFIYIRNENTGVDYSICQTPESMEDIDNIYPDDLSESD